MSGLITYDEFDEQHTALRLRLYRIGPHDDVDPDLVAGLQGLHQRAALSAQYYSIAQIDMVDKAVRETGARISQLTGNDYEAPKISAGSAEAAKVDPIEGAAFQIESLTREREALIERQTQELLELDERLDAAKAKHAELTN